MDIISKLAQDIAIKPAQVNATVKLLEEGATVPFIARYRKEVTGGLTDTQLRELETQLRYLNELEDRRKTILASIEEQDKLTPELKKSILAADNKSTLEDLYLPYKPKRHTKAQIAKEAGLEPLAEQLLNSPAEPPEEFAKDYLNPEKKINDIAAALEGAQHILMEKFAEDAGLLGWLREFFWQHTELSSTVVQEKEKEGQKFKDYFEYSESLKTIPSHRALALFRGRSEEVLRISLDMLDEHQQTAKEKIAKTFSIPLEYCDSDAWLSTTLQKAWRIKLWLKLELDALTTLRQNAEEDAINVFANNLRHLLMAAPAGDFITMGLDPGLRTGVKVVVVDGTGKLLTHTTIFPHVPRNEWDQSLATLQKLCEQHKVSLISIGNGTASRETDKLAAELIKKATSLNLTKIMVSEAGASVYSASELAAKEFPDLDVSFRGAVSIARRLQDPLAELVKIEPKSIGVGQYQHDVNQTKLGRSLTAVVEDCVNAVGVDINTASVPLLSTVAGLNETIAKNIVEYRDKNGRFADRITIKNVPGLGDKRFEQAAGFLRIMDGKNPLDSSAVHPEAYTVVKRILEKLNLELKHVMGKSDVLQSLSPEDYTDDHFGLPTVTDIIAELDKPGRDPRPEFKTAEFKEGIETINDLEVGFVLEGVVTNVANFGAFVDIGVHQDGLVHISQLADRFVKDPNEVVKVGDIVRVKVLEVDKPRKRISLSCRLDEQPDTPKGKTVKKAKPQQKKQAPEKPLADWQKKLAGIKSN